MKKLSLSHNIIRIFTATSLALSPLAQVHAAAETQPQTATGGGSGFPPTKDGRPFKPGDDESGGGFELPNRKTNKDYVLDTEPGHEFGADAKIKTDGTMVRYSGLKTKDGKIRVFRYTGRDSFVKVGLITDSVDARGEVRRQINWRTGHDTSENLVKIYQSLLAEKKAPAVSTTSSQQTSSAESAVAKKPFSGDPKKAHFGQFYKTVNGEDIYFAGTVEGDKIIVYKYRGRDLKVVTPGKFDPTKSYSSIEWSREHAWYEDFQKKANNGTNAGQVYKGARSSDGAEIYFTGQKDPITGRDLVWWTNKNATSIENAFSYGVIEENGSVKGTTFKPITHSQLELPPEFQKADFSPSKLGATLDMLKNAPASSRKAVQNWLTDFNGKQMTASVGLGVGSFYVAMGFIAAYQLMHDYPNNPVAWQQYYSQLTDPMGLAMIAGFMAFAYPFMSKTSSFDSLRNIGRSLPAFAAAMAVGMTAQGLIYYASQPDVRKCTGVDNYRNGFKRDLAACDRFFEEMSVPEHVTVTFAPSFAELIATSSIFIGAQYLTSVSGLSGFLRSTAMMQGTKGNLMAIVFSATAFLGAYEFSRQMFGIEKKTREFLIGTYNPIGSSYGEALPQAETNLYNSWKALKARGFNKTFVATPHDFEGVLKRYSNLQNRWRGIQLAETNEAYQQWQKKAEGYHQTLNSSRDAYAEFVNAIAANSFNANSVELVKKAATQKHTEFTTQNTTRVWKSVTTPHFYDFAVASMACGPEAEGYQSTNSLWTSTVNTISDLSKHLPGAYPSLKSMIDDQTGQVISFYPPRLVKRVQGVDASVCDSPAISGAIFSPANFPIVAHWYSSTPTYANLYDYISANIRENILSGGQNQFEKWWDSHVSPQVVRAELGLRKDYQKMLDQNYAPALKRSDYQWCDISSDVDKDLNGYLTKLSATPRQNCPAEAAHRNAYGIWNSLSDELRLYLALTIDAQVSSGDVASKNELIELGRQVMVSFDDLLKQLAQTRPGLRGDTSDSSQAVSLAFKHLVDKLDSLNARSGDSKKAYVAQVHVLVDKAGTVIQQASNLYNILTIFDSALVGDLGRD